MLANQNYVYELGGEFVVLAYILIQLECSE